MGKRYFCEYCQRGFQDNLTARNKHLKSSIHIKNKQLWYHQFRDTQSLYNDALRKKPCQSYLATGVCQFGNHCNYRHLSDQELYNLKQSIENEPLLSNEEILAKWFVQRKSTEDLKKEERETIDDETSYLKVPPNLKPFGLLPPSLQPPPYICCLTTCFNEWG
uniref:C3H1-type domain-containing protein n=1 Tax=Ciona intestinalis TaxID=7719 RepID=F6XU26_CIOIN|nr:zinc finger protein Ci-ZF(C3H/U1like)-1 isoform X2 [Ciona intestinalis]XP_026693693.1 zinc finger protein Ci-ZF(C3H/U1like)-1 isoform X2 [Ciona intestinalis]|eukprot:XP_026693692.1 zinc finger protein Ci-ZF(C3H/U1like)-1 isoform X2 [Ciona intestinalis]